MGNLGLCGNAIGLVPCDKPENNRLKIIMATVIPIVALLCVGAAFALYICCWKNNEHDAEIRILEISWEMRKSRHLSVAAT